MSIRDRDWHRVFASFREKGRRVARMVDFSDHAIVIQAAVLGQGIALDWLDSYLLSTGALVPGEEAAVGRRACVLPGEPRQPAAAARRGGGSQMDRGGDGLSP
jgi:DNA-binding transcriptional LysR family regulator